MQVNAAMAADLIISEEFETSMAFMTGRSLCQTVNAAIPQVKAPQAWEQNVPVWQKNEEENIT